MSTAVFPALCFGKLPSFADFVRCNAASREVLTLDQWVAHGLHAARTQRGAAWEQEFDGAPGYRFVFSPESTERFIVGVMRSSADKSKRRYPFFVSTLVSKRVLSDDQVAMMPALFSRFFDQADALETLAMNGIEARDIQHKTALLNIDALDSNGLGRQFGVYLESTTNEMFWRKTLGSFDDQRKYLIMTNLLDILTPFRGRSLSRLTLGLRFPLSSDAGFQHNEVCFWLRVCFALLDAPANSPVMFWTIPQPQRPSYLFVFFTQPSPKNFLYLLKPDMDGDTMCLLDEEGKDKLAILVQRMPPRQKALLESPTTTLKSFLEQIA
jgi:type VI secretion system ImpM family protein